MAVPVDSAYEVDSDENETDFDIPFLYDRRGRRSLHHILRRVTLDRVDTSGNILQFLDSLGSAALQHRLRIPYDEAQAPQASDNIVDTSSGAVGAGVTEPYTYRPLESSGRHIRILNLYPSQEGTAGDIRCSLYHADLDLSPTFSCLSYVWGDPSNPASILVDGRTLHVTQNLYRALRHFRTKLCTDGPIALWVDAVCINQEDLAERGAQVQLVTSLYAKADLVLMWLGPEADGSNTAMDLIAEFGKQGRNLTASDLKTWENYPAAVQAESWRALDALLHRPFWQRIWILQEFVLAKEFLLVCGNKVVWSFLFECAFHDWDDLRQVEYQLRSEYDEELVEAIESARKACNRIATHMVMRWTAHWAENESSNSSSSSLTTLADSRHRVDILDVVSESWMFEATDPRDRIFGLLGITRHNLMADYSRPLRDIYTGFTRNRIEEGRPDVILMAGLGVMLTEEPSCSLPSWVPDFSSMQKIKPLPWFDRRELYSAATSETLECGISATSSLDMVNITAAFCGQVSKILPLGYQEDGKFGLEDPDSELWRIFDPKVVSDRYPDGSPRLQALFRTLLMDTDGTGHRLMDSEERIFNLAAGFLTLLSQVSRRQRGEPVGELDAFEHLAAFIDWLKLDDENVDRPKARQRFLDFFLDNYPDIPNAWPEERGISSKADLYENFFTEVSNRMSKTNFFWMDDGYFGLGPKLCAESDIVCLVPGMAYPLMFRTLGNDDDKFEYVGPCFVLGFMDGEAVQRLGDDEFELDLELI